AAVAVDDVLDDFVATIVGEIHVDIGHLDALGVQEPLERQAVLDRVQIRDAEAVQDDAASGGPARSTRNAASACPVDEVPHEEDVRREASLVDPLQLILQPLT